MLNEESDFIVVGAGSAGCVVAARLSESPSTSVTLIEAGGTDRQFWARIPLGVGKMVNDLRNLWVAEAGPEPGLKNRSIRWISGRLLGGGSSVNGMLAVCGNPEKYDLLESAGCTGWNYAALSPYFRKLESYSQSPATLRGHDGPISISILDPGRLGSAFIEACVADGLQVIPDYNANFAEGVAPIQICTRNGLRSSAAVGYLHPAETRTNLRVATNTVVTRVLFEGRRAIGVCVTTDGVSRQLKARREVILCAGAIRSPQLLELSGIGQPDVLSRHGIPVLQPLLGVGENLQDHLMVRICYRARNAATIYDLLSSRFLQARELLKFAVFRRGMFASGSLMATAFVKSNPSLRYPDVRLQLGLSSSTDRVSKGQDSGLDPYSAFHIGGYFIHPYSRGCLHISSPDASVSPTIESGYLTDQRDREVTTQILKRLRIIGGHSPLSSHIESEIRPGISIQEDESLLSYAQENGDTCWHPIGTCKMGTDNMAVVDSNFLVRGVSGLRVVDASVLPFQVSSNTNIPTIMLAEKASDVLRDAHQTPMVA